MNDCNIQGIKILVSDYITANENYKINLINKFDKIIDKYALKRTNKSIFNFFGLFKKSTFKEAKTDLYLCLDGKKDFRSLNERLNINLYVPPYNNIELNIKMATLIQSKYMWVDIDTAKFVAENITIKNC